MNRLSNVLSPLDTCHGSSSSTTQQCEDSSANNSRGLKCFTPALFQDRRSQCSPTIGNILAIVVAVLGLAFFAISFLDGPYWPKIDDTFSISK